MKMLITTFVLELTNLYNILRSGFTSTLMKCVIYLNYTLINMCYTFSFFKAKFAKAINETQISLTIVTVIYYSS